MPQKDDTCRLGAGGCGGPVALVKREGTIARRFSDHGPKQAMQFTVVHSDELAKGERALPVDSKPNRYRLARHRRALEGRCAASRIQT